MPYIPRVCHMHTISIGVGVWPDAPHSAAGGASRLSSAASAIPVLISWARIAALATFVARGALNAVHRLALVFRVVCQHGPCACNLRHDCSSSEMSSPIFALRQLVGVRALVVPLFLLVVLHLGAGVVLLRWTNSPPGASEGSPASHMYESRLPFALSAE